MPPLVEYAIGNGTTDGTDVFKFLFGDGTPTTPQPRIERLFNPGVHYARYRSIGIGGREPFTLRTTRDVTDLDAGVDLAASYATFVGQPAQQLVWGDVDYDTRLFRVVVLSVEAVEVRSVVQWCGSFDDTNSKAKLIAQWTLEFKAI